jgi:hypothetical protein
MLESTLKCAYKKTKKEKNGNEKQSMEDEKKPAPAKKD